MSADKPERPPGLTEWDMAVYDTIRAVASGTRPKDLQLWRMSLDGREVAVIVQRVIDSKTAEEVGFQPLAMVLDHETAKRLRSFDGATPSEISPEGLEGSA